MTLLEEHATADCPFSAAIDYAAIFFSQHTSLSLIGTLALRSEVSTTFDVVLDRTDSSRVHQALHLDWSPGRTLPLPQFSGQLTVRPRGTHSDLILAGTYEPPFGFLGALFDSLLGNAIAHGTLRTLLAQVCASIEEQFQTFAARQPDIATLNRRDVHDLSL